VSIAEGDGPEEKVLLGLLERLVRRPGFRFRPDQLELLFIDFWDDMSDETRAKLDPEVLREAEALVRVLKTERGRR